MKYIFWDFNGTILDDAYICYEILNTMLDEEGQSPVEYDQYLMIFDFPVRDYYDKVYDLEKSSFDDLAVRFNKLYLEKSLACSLHENIIEIVHYFKSIGYKNVVLSASEINNLKSQLKYYKIDTLFDDVLGTSDINATGKADVAKKYIESHYIDSKDSVMIGDTIHDAEIAEILGVRPILFTKGHFHPSRLKNYETIDHLLELKSLFK